MDLQTTDSSPDALPVFPKAARSGRLGYRPIFVSIVKSFAETKTGIGSALLEEPTAGNTGKAFGEQAENTCQRFAQMLCPYDSPSKSIAKLSARVFISSSGEAWMLGFAYAFKGIGRL